MYSIAHCPFAQGEESAAGTSTRKFRCGWYLGAFLWPEREPIFGAAKSRRRCPHTPFPRHQKAAPPKIFWALLSFSHHPSHIHLVKISREESSLIDRFPFFSHIIPAGISPSHGSRIQRTEISSSPHSSAINREDVGPRQFCEFSDTRSLSVAFSVSLRQPNPPRSFTTESPVAQPPDPLECVAIFPDRYITGPRGTSRQSFPYVCATRRICDSPCTRTDYDIFATPRQLPRTHKKNQGHGFRVTSSLYDFYCESTESKPGANPRSSCSRSVVCFRRRCEQEADTFAADRDGFPTARGGWLLRRRSSEWQTFDCRAHERPA